MLTKNIDLLEKVGKRKPCETKEKECRNKKDYGKSIENRSEAVEAREEFGHWGIDIVTGNADLSEETCVYFCHPYVSYERGTSQNQHKIIRHFLSKHQSIQDVNEAQINRIQQWMIDYPR